MSDNLEASLDEEANELKMKEDAMAVAELIYDIYVESKAKTQD